MPASAAEELIGTYSSTRYTSDDGVFLIGVLQNRIVVKGNVLGNRPPVPHLTYRFSGQWKEHPKYGRSFQFDAYAVQEPKDRAAVIAYLLKYTEQCNIGPHTASRIVDTFGADRALGVLKNEPGRVAESIKRLSIADCRKAAAQLKENDKFESTVIELGQLLRGRSFHSQLMHQAVKKWGVLAPEVIRRDPFKLLVNRMAGAGFARCDSLYMDLGLSPTKLKRQMICAWDYMHKDMTGSIWFRDKVIERHLRESVGTAVNLDGVIQLGVRAGWFQFEVVDGKRFVASSADADHENVIAEIVNGMAEDANLPGLPAVRSCHESKPDSLPRRVLG